MSNKFFRSNYAMQLFIFLLLMAGCFVVYILFSALLVYMHSSGNIMNGNAAFLQDPKNLMLIKLLQSLSSIVVFLLPAFIFALIADTKPFQYLGLKNKFSFYQLLLIIVIIIACLPLVGLSAQWNEAAHLPGKLHGLETWARNTEKLAEQQTKLLLTAHHFSDYIINMIMIAVLPAICEELFFRGVMQKIFINWTGKIFWGIIITAFCFSFLHFEFLGFLPRFILGIFLGYIYVITGSIWMSVLAHFINNGLQVTLLYLFQSGIIKTDPTKDGTVPLFMGLLSLVIVLALFQWLRKISLSPVPTKNYNEPDGIG